MSYELGENRYGKAAIRLVTVRRGTDRHDLRDLTVDVILEGDFEAAHVAGDNATLVATDTMKNTVYALAKDRLVGSPEAFGLDVARHFAGYPQVSLARVEVQAHAWDRIATPDGPAADAFVRAGAGTRTAVVSVGNDAAMTGGGARGGGALGRRALGRGALGRGALGRRVSIGAGIEDLVVLKTTKSAFVGFERDAYTTLPEAEDRIMATKVTATWGYGDAATAPAFDFDAAHARAVERLLTTFAEHHSPSVQASLWVMASAMLDADPAIDWVRMVLPNLHHWAVDLGPFGLENRGEVFVATAEPHGVIDATVRRGS